MAQRFMPDSRFTPSTGIPARLLIAVGLLALSAFINYVDRGNLSIAAPMLKDELHISAAQLGLLLSAFFWTYAAAQLFYGWLVDHANVNWVLACAFFAWSVATAATGLVHAFAMLFALRLLLGMGEAACWPAYSKIIGVSFNEGNRGLANAAIASGFLLGPSFGILFGGLLMARYGWRPYFLVLGIAAMLWIPAWLKWMPEKKQAAPAESTGAPNLLEFLRMRSAWGACLGQFCANYINYFLLTWLPYFLVHERHVSMNEMARIGGIAYLSGALGSLLSGWLSDRWIAWGASPSVVRKTFTGGGIALSGIFLWLAVIGGPKLCVLAITLGISFFGVFGSNLWAIAQTLAGPQAAGRWTGFQNSFGNLAGILAPALTGYVLEKTGHFHWAMAIVAGFGLVSAAFWFFLVGPVEPVVWGRKVQA